jgi:acetyl esterase/lipase
MAATVPPPTAAQPGTVEVADDGTVKVPPLSVPVSSFLSPQGRAYLAQHLKDMRDKSSKIMPPKGAPSFLEQYLARDKVLFDVKEDHTKIAGVAVYVYTPAKGVSAANRHRVLINLHGGGFAGCFPDCSQLESLPIAALGGFKVVGVDYREGPDHRFPAASEDVAAVYSELLKSYRPENIGIYGCSAGGMLTGMAVAWLHAHNLPRPGAVGIFCAGLTQSADFRGFGGDADYMTAPIGESHMPGEPPPPKGIGLPPLTYLVGADPHDPLVAPANSPAVLAWFPPTLVITGTRGFEMSSAVYSHTQLVKAGVDAELHVWEGLFHGFFYNPDVPESRECTDVIIKFFERHLGG